MTADEFRADPERRSALAEVLGSPVLSQALEVLKDSIEPRAGMKQPLEDPVVASHLFHQHAGAQIIIKGLAMLSTAPKAPPAPPRGKALKAVPKDPAN